MPARGSCDELRCSPVGPVALCRTCRVASVVSPCFHGFRAVWPTFWDYSACLCASVRTLESLGKVFLLSECSSDSGSEARHNYIKTDELTAHTFQTRGRRRTFTAPRGSRQPQAGDRFAPPKDRPRPADGLQAAARHVRLVRPARDRRARPDRGPFFQLRTSLSLRTLPRSPITIKNLKTKNPFWNPKSPHPRTSTRPTSSRASSEFRQTARPKPSS